MLQEDEQLVRWVSQNWRAGVTLGQLGLLLELLGSTSIAKAGNGQVSRAVNYRQKLARLERGLGVGSLTSRISGGTRLNRAGEQVAGEVRLLLRELRQLEQLETPLNRWVIGAGDAWLQSVVAPALAAIPSSGATLAWEVRNLRAADIVRGLREGWLHFGFMRTADLSTEGRLAVQRKYRGTSLALIAGEAVAAPRTADKLLGWLRKDNRRFVQQGTTWLPLRTQLSSLKHLAPLLNDLDPAVICETHMQAAAAVAQTASWSIVPAKIAQLFSGPDVRIAEILAAGTREDMVLVTNPRNLNKLPLVAAATKVLVEAISVAILRDMKHIPRS